MVWLIAQASACVSLTETRSLRRVTLKVARESRFLVRCNRVCLSPRYTCILGTHAAIVHRFRIGQLHRLLWRKLRIQLRCNWLFATIFRSSKILLASSLSESCIKFQQNNNDNNNNIFIIIISVICPTLVVLHTLKDGFIISDRIQNWFHTQMFMFMKYVKLIIRTLHLYDHKNSG